MTQDNPPHSLPPVPPPPPPHRFLRRREATFPSLEDALRAAQEIVYHARQWSVRPDGLGRFLLVVIF